jgi:hypothetical protein
MSDLLMGGAAATGSRAAATGGHATPPAPRQAAPAD